MLVNNAGTHQNGPFEAATDEIWQADFDLKLFAAIRLSRAALPKMKERKWGRIINTLNSGAKWQRFGSAPTSVTRAAGMALTKVISNEGAPYNVLCNAVLVGLIQTDQWVRSYAKEQAEGIKKRPFEGVFGRDGAAYSDEPCRHCRRVRKHDPLPRLRRRQLRHWHSHQRRRRDVPGSLRNGRWGLFLRVSHMPTRSMRAIVGTASLPRSIDLKPPHLTSIVRCSMIVASQHSAMG